MSRLFAMAVPILPDKTDAWQKFLKELNTTWYSQFCDSRKKLNIHERTFLQKTPMGDFAIVTLEGENPEVAFAGFAEGNDEFTNWFIEQVKEIHGFDLRQPPPGPMPEMVIDSKG
jgi:hypothetical protein